MFKNANKSNNVKLENCLGLYLHIPFCKNKCPYCDFYSIKYDEGLFDLYIESLVKKIINWGKSLKDYKVDSIYFGGGTPSLLRENHLTRIIKAIKNSFKLINPEITIEINPINLHIRTDYSYLSELGVNRASIGMQSANNNELIALGRKHSINDTERTINLLKKAGIKNISLDLMLAIPYQTSKSLLRSIDFCKNQDITHVSAYLLKIEKETLFYKNRYSLNLLDGEQTSKLYLFAVDELKKGDFNQYEISNFCKQGKESRHNLKYWSCENYLGIGPSAHSFLNGKRFHYKNSLKDFINEKNSLVYDGVGGDEEEYSMLRLRLTKGLSNEEYKRRFKKDIPLRYYRKAQFYEKLGLVNCNNSGIKFTQKGFLVSNELICQIVLQ